MKGKVSACPALSFHSLGLGYGRRAWRGEEVRAKAGMVWHVSHHCHASQATPCTDGGRCASSSFLSACSSWEKVKDEDSR